MTFSSSASFKNIAIQVQNNALIINTFVGFDNNELHVTTSAAVWCEMQIIEGHWQWPHDNIHVSVRSSIGLLSLAWTATEA